MKALRELLLQRHQASVPKLDEIRRRAVASISGATAKDEQATIWLRTARKIWIELILPSRRAWSGLAAAWVAIAVMRLTAGGDLQAKVVRTAPLSEEVKQAIQEQHQMLVRLLDPAPREALEPAAKPGARGDLRQTVAVC